MTEPQRQCPECQCQMGIAHGPTGEPVLMCEGPDDPNAPDNCGYSELLPVDIAAMLDLNQGRMELG